MTTIQQTALFYTNFSFNFRTRWNSPARNMASSIDEPRMCTFDRLGQGTIHYLYGILLTYGQIMGSERLRAPGSYEGVTHKRLFTIAFLAFVRFPSRASQFRRTASETEPASPMQKYSRRRCADKTGAASDAGRTLLHLSFDSSVGLEHKAR